VLYLLAVAAIGAYCSRLNRTLADFVLGGRRLGVWVTAVSAQASDMSAWLLIGLPGAAYLKGLSVVWIVIGCAAGTVFNWVIVAPRLRRATERGGALTVPDYLAGRYGAGRGRLVRLIAVIAILTAYATYIASQFTAAGKTFDRVFAVVQTPWGTPAELGLGYHAGMLIGVGIILLYTTMGGFTAVAWTDLAQGMLMVVTVVVLPLAGIVTIGGPVALQEGLNGIDPALLSVTGGGADWPMFWCGVCLGGLAWGLGYPGQPHILVRFMALRDPKAMSRAATIGIVWVLVAMTGAILLGLVGRVMFDGLDDKEKVMPALAVGLMHPAIAGAMIAGAVAAMMSTVDSQLLVAASAVEQDVYIRLLGGRPQGRRAVWIGRITVLVLAAAALPIAWPEDKEVLATVLDAWGVLGAALGPAVILGLLTRRTNRWGAFVGIAVGLAVSLFWAEINWLFGGERYFTSGLAPGFVLNLILAYTVSLLTGRGGAGANRA